MNPEKVVSSSSSAKSPLNSSPPTTCSHTLSPTSRCSTAPPAAWSSLLWYLVCPVRPTENALLAIIGGPIGPWMPLSPRNPISPFRPSGPRDPTAPLDP
uniref:Uncharacterized protein n=1 Tax=Gouania willdenowi TaxID=441366 RepID=A0A8C5GMT4_GOUWI